MLIELVHRQLYDLQRLCKLAHEAARSAMGKDYDKSSIQNIYTNSRENLLDIIRELDLGHNVDWNIINGMLRTMESKD